MARMRNPTDEEKNKHKHRHMTFMKAFKTDVEAYVSATLIDTTRSCASDAALLCCRRTSSSGRLW